MKKNYITPATKVRIVKHQAILVDSVTYTSTPASQSCVQLSKESDSFLNFGFDDDNE